jgi:hypothetical protein
VRAGGLAAGSKKGHEILDALETGTSIHLWARRKKTDVAFTYCGLVVPISRRIESYVRHVPVADAVEPGDLEPPSYGRVVPNVFRHDGIALLDSPSSWIAIPFRTFGGRPRGAPDGYPSSVHVRR